MSFISGRRAVPRLLLAFFSCRRRTVGRAGARRISGRFDLPHQDGLVLFLKFFVKIFNFFITSNLVTHA